MERQTRHVHMAVEVTLQEVVDHEAGRKVIVREKSGDIDIAVVGVVAAGDAAEQADGGDPEQRELADRSRRVASTLSRAGHGRLAWRFGQRMALRSAQLGRGVAMTWRNHAGVSLLASAKFDAALTGRLQSFDHRLRIIRLWAGRYPLA